MKHQLLYSDSKLNLLNELRDWFYANLNAEPIAIVFSSDESSIKSMVWKCCINYRD